MTATELGDGSKVDRGILANGCVRASAGLDADNAILGQGLGTGQDQRVLAGVYVVRHHCQREAAAHGVAEHLGQGGLARTDRPADPDAQRSVGAHVRKIREGWVSCRIEAISDMIVADPRSSIVETAARAAVARIGRSKPCRMATASIWPMRARRCADDTRLLMKAER